MNVLVLVVVVGGSVCGALSQPTLTTHHHRDIPGNYTNHVAITGKEIQVHPDRMTLETEVKTDTRMQGNTYEGLKSHNYIRRKSKANRRLQIILKNTEAKILEINKKHPNRGKLKALPGLERLKEEEILQINATLSPHAENCIFVCPTGE